MRADTDLRRDLVPLGHEGKIAMPYYPGLRKLGDRLPFAAGKLIDLRAYLAKTLPVRRTDGQFLLGTWNIRDFGGHRLNPQPRLLEALHFIAEIISHFDLVAVQEVNRDLSEFYKMMDILGRDYDFIATDVAETDGGNDERMAFVYDRRKVSFRGIAGEVVLSKKDLILKDAQFVRTPFVVSFQVGWLKVDLCTVHLYYGEDSGEKLQRRIAETSAVGRFFVERSKKESANTILLGDFNIVAPGHPTMQALLDTGFTIPEAIQSIPTNPDEDKHYDQIAHYSPDRLLRMPEGLPSAGKVRFCDVVFDKEADYKALIKPPPGGKALSFEKWRTWQMSDHFLLWNLLVTDFADEYLKRFGAGQTQTSNTIGP